MKDFDQTDDPLEGMSYEAKHYLRPIIKEILNLSPGQSILIKAKNEKNLVSARNHFYNWRTRQGLKKHLKTYREGPLHLRVLRVETISSFKIVQERPYTPVEDFVRNNMLELRVDEGIAFIHKAIKKGILEEEDYSPILTEFCRVMGVEEEKGKERKTDLFTDIKGEEGG